MSNQVVTIGYLKTFVNGVISVNTTKSDSYCPTYAELTGGTLVQNYSAGTNPTNHKPGIKIPSCTVGIGYTNDQLVIRQDLQLLWYVLQSVDVSASPTTISCCGGSSTLSTTAYFNLSTKKENGITSASTNTSTVITSSYSDDKSYTTISGNKITFSKNSVNYPNSTSAAARSTTVTSTYQYSGVTKTDTVTITQNSNSVGGWTWISNTTTSISVSPASMSFDSGGGSKSYSVTRYYTSYYERYDSCDTLMGTNTDSNSTSVTPTGYNCTGGFTCTSSKVSCDTNTGSSRTGTLTVTWGGFSDTCSLSQGASQAGTTNGEPYNYDYYLSVSTPSGKISCDGGSATFTARYVTTWDYDWETKNDAGEVTNSGTSSDSSSTNVTNSAEWSTTVGSVSKGTLTLGAYDEDTRRTATVTAKYNGYSDSDYVYQESCAPDTPITPPATPCMTIFYTISNGAAATVYFKTTNGTQQGSHEVDAQGSQQLCNIAEGTDLVVSCNNGDVTVGGDTSFTFYSGTTASISLTKTTTYACILGTTSTMEGGTGSTITIGSGKTETVTIYSIDESGRCTTTPSRTIGSSSIVASCVASSLNSTSCSNVWTITAGSSTGTTNITFNNGCTTFTLPIKVTGATTPSPTVYQYSFKNCYSDRQIGLFASNATPSGSHLNFALLSASDGTSATVLVTSNNGTLVNGSTSNSSSSAKIGDSVKVYSVTNTTNIWTLEETITLTASNRSFEYGCSSTPTSCTCSVTSISVSPTTHTFTSNSSKSFTVTINDNDCDKCKGGFKVYNSSGTYVTSGTSSFSLSNQTGTFTIRANDNAGKTCTVTTTKYVDNSCTCSVTSISVSPSTHTFTSNSSKSFSVTINDNDCSGCTNQFLVYNSSGTYVTSGTNSFSLSNQSGTFTIRAKDNTGKTCTVTTTKYTAPVYVFKFNNPTGGFDSTSTETHIIHKSVYEGGGPTTTLTSTKDGSNVGYTMSSNVNWITTSTALTTCSWNISKNTSTSSRSGTITLTQSGSNKTLIISVTQGGAPATCDCSTVSISCNPTNSYTTGNSVSTIVTVNAGSNCSTRWKAYSSSGSYLGEGESGKSLSRTTTGTVTFRSDACTGKTTTWTISEPECKKPSIRLTGSSNDYSVSSVNETAEWCDGNVSVNISTNCAFIGNNDHDKPVNFNFEMSSAGVQITSISCDKYTFEHGSTGAFGIDFTITPSLDDGIFGGNCNVSGSFTWISAYNETGNTGTFSISIQFNG